VERRRWTPQLLRPNCVPGAGLRAFERPTLTSPLYEDLRTDNSPPRFRRAAAARRWYRLGSLRRLPGYRRRQSQGQWRTVLRTAVKISQMAGGGANILV
jgi:hypothetical protein